MAKGMIRLVHRIVIDNTNTNAWEKCALNDSYTEFLMQVQLYNKEKKYHTFSELQQQVPGAEKLHFLVSASVTAYIRQFNGLVPGIVNIHGKPFLPFKQYRFEIIDSDVANAANHCIAISFVTEPCLWIDTIGSTMIIAPGAGNTGNINIQEEVFTETVTLSSRLSIYSFKPAENLWYHNQTEKCS
ncbi:MAG TPA: hypothetical protein VHB48_07045 [Chitinophagaceae bacterium]|nr:hypothetical protein [Chitinophagaceae bacterium]